MLVVKALGKRDLLASKLYAFCDRDEQDLGDILGLKPTLSEVESLREWLSPSEDKKLLSREGVIAANQWLRIRALFGANHRAGIANLLEGLDFQCFWVQLGWLSGVAIPFFTKILLIYR